MNVRTLVLAIFLLTATVASAQFDTLFIKQGVNYKSIQTGNVFVDTINYSWSNFTTNATNAVATVTLPQNLVPASTPISSAVNFQPSQVSSVTYNSTTNVVTITCVSPLPAGSTGQLTLNLEYVNGTTPNGYAPNIITSINATNNNNSSGVANGPSYDTVSVTAIAANTYYVNKTIKAGGAINNLTIYSIAIGENNSGVGSLNLKNPTFVDTLPKGAQFVTATAFNGSYPPVYNQANQTITWTWGTPGVDTTLSSYGSTAYVSVNYLTDSSFALGQNVCNHATLSGSEPVLPGIGTYGPVAASGSVCENLATPIAGGDCNGGGISAATAWWLDHHVLAGTTGNNFSEGWYNSGNTSLSEVDLAYTIDKSIDFTTINVNPVYDGFDSAIAATIQVSYITNLNPTDTVALGTYQSLSIASGATPSSFTPSLSSGVYITQVLFKVTGNLPIASYESLSYQGTVRTIAEGAKDGSAIVEGSYLFPVGSDGGTVIYNNSTGSYTYNGVTKSYSACKDSAEIIAPQPVFYTGTNKSIQNGSSFNASDTVNYQLNTYLGGNANATNVVFSDTLDNRLTYIPSSSTYTYNGTTNPITPVITTATDGTNRIILTYNLASVAPSSSWFDINFNAEINPGTLPGTIGNAFTLGSDNALFNTVTPVVNLNILSSVALRAYKGQSGCDPTYVYYPTYAQAQAGGPVNYKITLKNLGNVAANNLVMVDVFPFISDYRGSQWYANLASPVTINDPSSTVYYTTVNNPCYTDFNPATNPSGCNTPSWSTTPPVDLTTVRAIKVTRSATIPVLDSIILTWPMVAPVGAPQGLVMDNSVTYQVNRADNGSQLLPATPAKVGMYTNCTPTGGSIGNYVWIDSNRNGRLDEDSSLGLNGVKVYLYSTPDGTYGSGVLIDSTITSNNWTGKPGLYEFVNLQSGQYYVKFPVAYNGDSLTKVVNQTAETDNNSDANSTTGLSEIVTINTSSSNLEDVNNTTIDAGYVPYGSLGNYVWYDVNSNGLQDDGATNGINGVKVYLYELENGTYTKVDSTVTADSAGISDHPGYYNFVIDSSGLYKVLFPKTVSTKTLTIQDTTLDKDGNSDAYQSTGFSEVVVMNNFVTPGYNENNPTIDAGYVCNVQKPVLTLQDSTLLCDNTFGLFTATDTTYGAVYTWYKASSVISGSTTDTLHTSVAGSTPSPAGNYWVTITDTGGCISHNSDTITITTVASITGSASVCIGSTITLSDVTTGGTWSSQYDTVATVSSTGKITPVSAGTTTISYVVPNTKDNCSTAKTKVITVDTLPNVQPIVATQSAVCAGGTTNYTASLSDATTSNGTHTWSSSNTADATVNSSAGVVTGVKAGSVTISYAFKNTYGCTTTVTTPITINALPTVASITGTTAVCVGSMTTLADATTGGTWSSANNTYATVDATGDVTGVAKGTEAISYTVKDTNSCTTIKTSTVTVNPLPTASISGTTAVCQNTTAPSVTFTGANATAPYTFTYTLNGTTKTITTTSGNSVSVIAPTSTAGSFVYALVSVQDNSSTHCAQAATGSATITVNPLPTATISGTTAVCQNSIAPAITFTGANGTAPYTFTYKIGSGSSQTVTTTSGNSVTVSAPTSTVGSTTYTLTSVHDASSTACSQAASGTATVTVNPLPTATISGDTSVCQNILPTATKPNITFTAANGTAPYTFTYMLNGTTETVTTTSGNSVTVAVPVNVAGTFTYSLVSVQDASSTACTQSASGSVTVIVKSTPAPPAPSLTTAPQYCIGEVVLKSDTAAAAYQWYKDGVAVSGATSQSYNPIATGNYTVVLTSSQGCSSISPATYAYVYVTATPVVTINGNGSAQLCGGNSVQLSSSSGYSSYQWYFNGNPIATGLTISASQAGSYTVVTTDGTGCTSYASTPVALVNVAAPATPSITGNTTICGSGSTVLSSSVTASNYQWYLNGSAIYGATSSTYTASTVGNYSVTVSNASCSASSAIDAIVATTANFTYAATTVSNTPCLSGNSISFNNTSVGAVSYQWYTNDSLVSTSSTTADTTFTAANTYNVKLVVTSGSGCKDSITQPIYVYSCSVSSGSTGGLESKSLGAAIGERNFNIYKEGKNGPVQYTQSELIAAPKKGSFGTFGVGGSSASLTSLMPYMVNPNYVAYDQSASVADLTSITNAIDVRAIDFTQSNLPKAVAFATETVGGIYSHTKPICDRLKGAQLLDIENIQIQGYTFIQYKILQPNGDLEYAISFSAGIKGGTGTYSIQSEWLMPDYISQDTMLNYQLWAASPVDVNTMVTEVLGKLQSNMPIAQLSTINDLPQAYVSAASRQGTNLNLTVNNRTVNTTGYFTLTQRANEITTASDNVVVPFTVNANGTTTVSIPVSDSYDANISMFFNNTTTDMLYMADGIWGTSGDNQTTVSQFNVNNNASRVYPANEYPLLRDVQVQVTTPTYLSIYKYLKGGATAANLNAYKSFHFTTNTNAEGMTLQVTITKQSVTNWNSQYTYTISNYQDGQTYKLALSDFKSNDSTLPATIDLSDVTSVVYNVINPTGQSVSITTGISNAAFSTADIAYEESLEVKVVSVTPNPNNGHFTVSFESPSAAQLTLKVIDLSGRTISTIPVNAITGKNEVAVNLNEGSTTGVYFVSLVGQTVKYNTREILIKK
jgi:hypothetical protein